MYADEGASPQFFPAREVILPSINSTGWSDSIAGLSAASVDPFSMVAAVATGIVAGFFNVTAGGGSTLPLLKAHAIKVAIVLILQLATLPVFLAAGAVDWFLGLLLAAGLAAGGYIEARVTLKGSGTLMRMLLGLPSWDCRCGCCFCFLSVHSTNARAQTGVFPLAC